MITLIFVLACAPPIERQDSPGMRELAQQTADAVVVPAPKENGMLALARQVVDKMENAQ